ncbi:MAG: PIN domain-containing protein [Candidatus Rokubacteria bacterium]|nr:PIN domain-containing protein [Candidatus Rokubacteria bacterium]
MVYLDASVALAHIFAEDRVPPGALWDESLIASRLIQYEIWTRVHARGIERSHGDEVRALLERVALVEMTPLVLARAAEPFPLPVRTLDALHLATVEFLRGRGQALELATYDDRMLAGARALGIPVRPL